MYGYRRVAAKDFAEEKGQVEEELQYALLSIQAMTERGGRPTERIEQYLVDLHGIQQALSHLIDGGWIPGEDGVELTPKDGEHSAQNKPLFSLREVAEDLVGDIATLLGYPGVESVRIPPGKGVDTLLLDAGFGVHRRWYSVRPKHLPVLEEG